jgi:hypothetical protein
MPLYTYVQARAFRAPEVIVIGRPRNIAWWFRVEADVDTRYLFVAIDFSP